MLCWHNVVPEMNHNELLGWRTNINDLAVVYFRNKSDFDRNQIRMDINRKVISKFTNNITEVWSKGDSQMELYVAYKDYVWMMDLVEEMVEKIAMDLHGTTKVKVGESIIDFQRPWKRYTMYEVINHFTGVDISEMDEQTMAETAKKLKVEVDVSMGRGKLVDKIF